MEDVYRDQIHLYKDYQSAAKTEPKKLRVVGLTTTELLALGRHASRRHRTGKSSLSTHIVLHRQDLPARKGVRVLRSEFFRTLQQFMDEETAA